MGMIILNATSEDVEKLDTIIKNMGCKQPNVKLSVYKNRGGSVNRSFVWMNADKGTCRFEPLFVTDYDYRLNVEATTPSLPQLNKVINLGEEE